MFFLVSLLITCMMPLSAMHTNRSSVGSEQGSILQARHARELAQETTSLHASQEIEILVEEKQKDPNSRQLLKVTIEDALEADSWFTTLMGDDVTGRRSYIEEFGHFAKNLDV